MSDRTEALLAELVEIQRRNGALQERAIEHQQLAIANQQQAIAYQREAVKRQRIAVVVIFIVLGLAILTVAAPFVSFMMHH